MNPLHSGSENLSNFPQPASFSSVSQNSLTKLAVRLNWPTEDAVRRTEEAEKTAFQTDYPFRMPTDLEDRIQSGNVEDPVLTQFLPQAKELLKVEGFENDPLAEFSDVSDASLIEGGELSEFLLKKYAHRVLLLIGGTCAANCRFCFRRHFREEKGLFAPASSENERKLSALVRFLESDPSITELILSGGDPLGISDEKMSLLVNYIKRLSFVKRVRIHTRFPVLVPKRVTPALESSLSDLRRAGKELIVVFHINHPQEVNDEVGAAFQKFAKLGALLLSQTVLLKGVNDSPAILAELYSKIASFGVLPYYLHQLDRVAGAAHFEVEAQRGLAIVNELRRILPGYLVPRYVRELPNQPAKIPVEMLENGLDLF